MNNKFLSLCGCLFLSAVFGALGAAGGIYVYRQMYEALVPQLANEIAKRLEAKISPQPKIIEELPKNAPTLFEPASKSEIGQKTTAALLPLYYWDLDRVMSQSKAGKMLIDYAVEYAQVMEHNAATLRKALKKGDKSPKAEEARTMIAKFEKQRIAAASDARAFVRKLVENELKGAPQFVSVYVLENKDAFTLLPVSADVTHFLIDRLNEVTLNLPQLPKAVGLQQDIVVSEKNNSKEKKK